MVDRDFTRRVDGGDVLLVNAGRTIYASVFKTNNVEAEEAIEKMIEGRPGIPVQMFDREEPGILGPAYLLPEGGFGAGCGGATLLLGLGAGATCGGGA